ncbi:MAG: ROK family protein [Candidatus Cybelea sp.]
MPVIVADAGGTYLRFAVADDAGMLHMYSRRPIPNSQAYFECPIVWESIVESIVRYVREVENEARTGDAIAIALPGPVVDGCRLVAAPTVTGRYQSIPDIAGSLAAQTGRKIYLLNDVSAAAWYLGERLDAQRFFVVTVSSGIGGKLFDRRHSECVFDSAEYAGEIGHIVVDPAPDARQCDCGGRGHLGAISSGRGTESLARRLARSESDRFGISAIAQTNVDPELITNEEHLVPAALAGDRWALSVIERAARPLAQVLSVLTSSLGLDCIVVIGGFAQRLGKTYKEALRTHMSELLSARAFAAVGDDLVCVWNDGEEVCLAGAAAFYQARRGVS